MALTDPRPAVRPQLRRLPFVALTAALVVAGSGVPVAAAPAGPAAPASVPAPAVVTEAEPAPSGSPAPAGSPAPSPGSSPAAEVVPTPPAEPAPPCTDDWSAVPRIEGIAFDTVVTEDGAEVVGFYSQKRATPFRASLVDGLWELLPAPFPGSGILTGVDASGQGDLWSVGGRQAAGIRPIALRRIAAGPARRLPIPKLPTGALLTDVAASDPTHAVAVGFSQSRRGQSPLVIRWRPGEVRREPVPVRGDAALVAVTAPTSGRTVAAGWRRTDAGVRPILLRRDGAAWRQVRIPAIPDEEAILAAVATDETGRLLAGGTIHAGDRWLPFLVENDGSGWHYMILGEPGPAGSVGLVRTLLIGEDDIIVGGARWTPGARPGPLFGHWRRGIWVEEPVPGDPILAELLGSDRAGGARWIVGSVGEKVLALRSCRDTALQARDPGVVTLPAETPASPLPSAAASPSPGPRRTPKPLATASPAPAVRAGAWVVRDIAPSAGLGVITTTYGGRAADFDRDGWIDLIIGGHGRPPLLLRNDQGRFVPALTGTFPRGDRHGCATGRVNGEGPLDLVCVIGAHHGTGFKRNEVWIDPFGKEELINEADERGLQDPFGRGRNAVLFDADRDGDDDLLVTNEPGRLDALPSSNRFYRNVDGRFVPAPGAGLDDAIGGGCVIPADLDRDGWTDLVLCGWVIVDADAFLRVYLNRKGRFVESTEALGLGGVRAEGALVRDLDGDGRPDVAQVSTTQLRVSLRLADGRYFTAFDLPLRGGTAIAAGDADGDGDEDLYVVRATTGRDLPDVLYLNGGNGRSWSPVRIPAVDEGSGEAVVAFDHDNDGTDAFLVLNGTGLEAAGPIQLIRIGRV